jgi:hypothetical protein
MGDTNQHASQTGNRSSQNDNLKKTDEADDRRHVAECGQKYLKKLVEEFHIRLSGR